MSVARIIKTVFGVLIVTVSVLAFWPQRQTDGDVAATSLEVGDRSARFIIHFAPGWGNMPGTIPHGLGKPLRGIREVAREFVRQFPDTCIVFRNVPVSDREWLVTQLMSGQAPDVINVNVEDVWVDTHKGWYLPLDGYLEQPNPFVPEGEPGSRQWWGMFKYQAISRGKAAPIDGKMYCVSFDMIETGIFYNKSKFDELGIDPPQTWAEFEAIQNRMQAAGYTPFLTVIEAISDWGVDLLFDQFYAEILPGIDLVQDPVREQYLQGYLDWDEIAFLYGRGFFTGGDARYREIFSVMKDWRRYWNQDLSVRSMDRMRPFIRQEGLMIWDSSQLTHRLEMDKTLGFEYGVFYLPPLTEATSRFAPRRLLPTCVIGGAATQFSVTNRAFSDTSDPATSERLRRVIQFLQFMCLPENAQRITNESLQFIPNIVGVQPRPEMQPFIEILKRRYTTTKWVATFDLQFNDILQRMLGLYLNGGCDLDECLSNMERALELGAERAIHRKKPDLAMLERRWKELAPLRRSMKELPDGAR